MIESRISSHEVLISEEFKALLEALNLNTSNVGYAEISLDQNSVFVWLSDNPITRESLKSTPAAEYEAQHVLNLKEFKTFCQKFNISLNLVQKAIINLDKEDLLKVFKCQESLIDTQQLLENKPFKRLVSSLGVSLEEVSESVFLDILLASQKTTVELCYYPTKTEAQS